jgi:hypothetical protein
MWAGLSIMTMWLAVLFVGVLGGNIVNSSGPGGSSSSVPVVVALLPFVLPATTVVARRGFRELGDEEQGLRDERTRAWQTAPPHSELRTKPAGRPAQRARIAAGILVALAVLTATTGADPELDTSPLWS